MDTTTATAELFTASDFARELEIIHDWREPEIEAFFNDAGAVTRTFEEWVTIATGWARGFDANLSVPTL